MSTEEDLKFDLIIFEIYVIIWKTASKTFYLNNLLGVVKYWMVFNLKTRKIIFPVLTMDRWTPVENKLRYFISSLKHVIFPTKAPYFKE